MKNINSSLSGLSTQAVEEQTALGNINTPPQPIVKSNLSIIFGHIFNLFNAYNFLIAGALFIVQAYSSMLFIIVVISNTFIRAFQEIRSKNTIKKLNLIISSTVHVVRDGTETQIDHSLLVLGDIVHLYGGNQISADTLILQDQVEVDESLLTGEADPILKSAGDQLLSGSFIVSGSCYGQVIHVGAENYATKITNEARNRKPIQSELMKTFNWVTRFTSFFIIPIGALLIYQAFFVRQQSVASTIINTSTALMGMLPKGLVLLTSVSLAASVIKLGTKKVLIQELFSIESLARVDTLCLDKTGTLTEGIMKLESMDPFIDETQFKDLMVAYVSSSLDSNATFRTLKAAFPGKARYAAASTVSFSSARKWSCVNLEEYGALIVGAPEIIVPQAEMSPAIIERCENGARVLMVAHQNEAITGTDTFHNPEILGYLLLSDPLRKDAKSTLAFFLENEVNVKVISGDNPKTVGAIARKAGLEFTDVIDSTTLVSDEDLRTAILNYDIFGRATPAQKHKMILFLQEAGHKVAMTGDGVNDVLALKDADVSIAMGNGSDASRTIAQVIIIDGKLSTLIDIVREGRLVINNITRSASMYYLKTMYIIGFSILAILLNIPFPFIPFQITIMDMFVEGFPSFMLTFERIIDKPKESIASHVLRFSMPNALAITLSLIVTYGLAVYFKMSQQQLFTMLFFICSFISIQLIYRIYKPLNIFRTIILILDILGLFVAIYLFAPLLDFSPINLTMSTIIVLITLLSFVLVTFIAKFVGHLLDRTHQNA